MKSSNKYAKTLTRKEKECHIPFLCKKREQQHFLENEMQRFCEQTSLDLQVHFKKETSEQGFRLVETRTDL